MASVTFENVSRIYDGNPAVNNLSMEVEDGEFLVLVGPSGCGKSTTLRMLAGLEPVSSGRILIGDRLVNNVPARDRDIAMVFQSYALYPHMSVYDNMAFALRMRKVQKSEVDRRVREAAGILSIEALLKRKPGQLSGGQRQRVALGRAIVRDPAVFLLDEPLSNLDASLRVQTRAELSKLHERLGTTFVYVTHDQVEAMTMATRIAVLDRGVLQQLGTPLELYEHPQNRFVAGFIGSPSMNFLEMTVESSGEGARLQRPGITIPVASGSPLATSLRGQKDVLVGIRPEHLYDPRFRPAETRTTDVEATVDLTELMGNEVFVHTTIGDARLLARLDPRSGARAGQPFTLGLDYDRIHVFDRDTGVNLETQNTPGPAPAAAR
jgi:multiple sugar transport system ATP-binding protein